MYKNYGKVLLSFTVIAVLWKILSLFASPLVLPPPEVVFLELFDIIFSSEGWKAVGSTSSRAFNGLGHSLVIGVALGLVMAPLSPYIRPVIVALQNVPLVSWVLLAIIWFGFTDANVSFVVFIATLPVIYLNTIAGVESIDRQLIEMAGTFKFPSFLRWYAISLPSVATYVSSGISIAIALMWKSAVMAELLVSRHGIGTELGISRTYLLTERLMAWTILLVILGLLTEFLWRTLIKSGFFLRIFREGFRRIPFNLKKAQKEDVLEKPVCLKNVSKGFYLNGEYFRVLKDITWEIKPGNKICLIGPSGVGKTTLLKIIAGIIKADSGSVDLNGRECTMMFQEHRLLPWLTAEENAMLALRSRKNYKDAQEKAGRFLDIFKIPYNLYPHELSGGMKQTVSLARTFSVSTELVLLDEPFKSSDPDQIERMREVINNETTDNSMLIYVTHQWEDVLPYVDRLVTLAGNPAELKETIK